MTDGKNSGEDVDFACPPAATLAKPRISITAAGTCPQSRSFPVASYQVPRLAHLLLPRIKFPHPLPNCYWPISLHQDHLK